MDIPSEQFQAAAKLRLCFAVLRRNFGKVKLHHVALENATVILRCKPPMGSPPPNITWYKNGEPLFLCRGRRLRASAKKLVLKGVSTNDSGNYQCVAENMAARRQGPMITLELRGGESCFCFRILVWEVSSQKSQFLSECFKRLSSNFI